MIIKYKKVNKKCDDIRRKNILINEIVNSFILDPITHKRLSNGFIEGKNNFCKTIKRIGFGYSDFDVFRYKIITTNKKAKQIKK